MFVAKEDDEYNPQESKFYIWLNKILPLTTTDGNGKFTIKEHGKTVFTSLFVVVFMLAVTDILFAFDSIPAVMGISKDSMIIYTSNIFAVLGLRSLFFLLQGAVNKFQHLQKGISIVLVFIGVKMLIESFLLEYISKSTLTIISLFVIILCIMLSIAYSIYHNKKMK
jgi:tellurite resistance protein TerC